MTARRNSPEALPLPPHSGSNDRTAAQRLSEEVLADLRQSPDGKSWQYARTIAEQVHERL